MSRIVYVNGRYLPYADANVHVEDRGFQFADAVYEVIEVRAGTLIDADRHLDRLKRSLNELKIAPPMGFAPLAHVINQVVLRNRVQNGLAYLQVTRGAMPRDFCFPPTTVRTTLVCLARSQPRQTLLETAERGIKVITMPDIRWKRCDIKTVMLLPACLAKEEARSKGAAEAWFFDVDEMVTEGASSNAWIIDSKGQLITRALDEGILPGITRAVLLDLIGKQNLAVIQRPFSISEAKKAAEAFITSATNTVMPVISIDNTAIGDGTPGPITRKFRQIYQHSAQITDNCDRLAKDL